MAKKANRLNLGEENSVKNSVSGEALRVAPVRSHAVEVHSDAFVVPENGTEKSAEKSVNGRPFVAGYDPRRGHGPKPGAPNAGRPPDEFYEWLDGAVNNPKVRERYEAILGQGDPDLFLKALKWGDERLRGKPSQSIEHGGTATVILKAVRE